MLGLLFHFFFYYVVASDSYYCRCFSSVSFCIEKTDCRLIKKCKTNTVLAGYAPISHSLTVRVGPSVSSTVTLWQQHITVVAGRQCWTAAQTLSAAAARQRQCRASECIQPAAVRPADVAHGGAQVIELLSLKKMFVQ